MVLSFEILSAILLLVTLYEYIRGMVLDLTFVGILAQGQHSRGRLMLLLLSKFMLWILTFIVFFSILGVETEKIERASVRQTFLVLFVVLIVPLALLRKPYAKWVARTSSVHSKSK